MSGAHESMLERVADEFRSCADAQVQVGIASGSAMYRFDQLFPAASFST